MQFYHISRNFCQPRFVYVFDFLWQIAVCTFYTFQNAIKNICHTFSFIHIIFHQMGFVGQCGLGVSIQVFPVGDQLCHIVIEIQHITGVAGFTGVIVFTFGAVVFSQL